MYICLLHLDAEQNNKPLNDKSNADKLLKKRSDLKDIQITTS